MKKLMLAAVVCLTVAACNDDKGDEKKVMDDILKTHEKVMSDEGHAVDNKMFIDSLIKNNKLGDTSKTKFDTLSKQLETADDRMSEWMQKFDPEYKGKSHADMMDYLTKQRSQINKIDSQLNDAIKQSDKALANYKK